MSVPELWARASCLPTAQGDVMDRRQRAFFEKPVSPGELASWEEVLTGGDTHRQARDPAARLEPFPAAFCLLIIIFSSLTIYAAAYGLLALLI
jgi:hypothetical protein